MIDGADLVYKVVHGSLAGQQGLRVPLNDSGAGQVARTNTPQLMGDVADCSHVNRNLIERLKLRSAVFAPIARGSTVLRVLKLRSSLPDAFTDRDLEQARLFAGAAMAGLTEVAGDRAKRAVEANNIYWRGLFDRFTEGFIVGEAIRNDLGKVTD